MGLKEDILAMKQEVEEVKQQSFAMEMLKDSKKANKTICRAFSVVIIIFVVAYFVTVALFLRYIDNIGCEEEIINSKTQEITDVESIDNSSIVNGDMYGNNKTN